MRRYMTKNSGQVPRSESQSSKKKEEEDNLQSTELTPIRKKRGSRTPIKRCIEATFKEMDEETQAGQTTTPSENINNQTRTGTQRSSRGDRHRNATRKKKSGIPNTFKGSVPEVGAVIRTKDENHKESFQNLQECVLQYVVENYKKGVDIAPLIRNLENVEESSKEPKAPTGTGNRAPTEISKKIYELEPKRHLDRADIQSFTPYYGGSVLKHYTRSCLEMRILRTKKSFLALSGSCSKSPCS